MNRDFRIENPSDAPRDARLGLLCLGELTTDPPPVDEYTNTASVSSTTPDPDSADRTDSVTVDAGGPSAPPAPFAPPAPAGAGSGSGGSGDDEPEESPASIGGGSLGKSKLSFKVSCTVDCSGTATVFTPKKVHAAGITISGGQPVGRGHFNLDAGERGEFKVQIGKRKAKAIRKAKLKSLIVDVSVAGNTTTQQIPLK